MPGDNTLRPYYDHDTFNAGYLVIFKPGVGLIDTSSHKEITSSFGHGLSQNGKFLAGNVGIGLPGLSPRSVDPLVAEKNYAYDLELSEYFDFSNLLEVLKNLMWNFFKNYCRILLSQPLDMVRLILQVGRFNFSARPQQQYTRLAHDMSVSRSLDDDDDEIDFFQPTQLQTAAAAAVPESPQKPRNSYKIHPVSQHTVDIMSAIAAKDGPFALFRGINASFIHYTLSHTIEAWITGFLSPFLNIPDPFFLDLTHSTEPVKSLWLSVLACVITGVILMPLDLIKVRFMLTPFNKAPVPETEMSATSSNSSEALAELAPVNPRSIRDSLRHYPLKLLLGPPPSITLLTVLYQFSTIVFRKSAPYFLFVRYNIDSYLSPNWFTLVNLMLLITEFFIKLPVENLLRKEQVRFLLRPKSLEEDPYHVVTIENPEENLIVDFNGWGASHTIESGEPGLFGKIRNLGLFKGWRVGVLNVIGFWGYNILKSTSVMTEERL